MMKGRHPEPIRAVLLLAVVMLSLSSLAPAVEAQRQRPQRRPANPAFEPWYEMARRAYRSERAFDIVAFMDSLWRLPGNTDFDASIARVEVELLEAGYRPEESAAGYPFTYRIEHRPLRGPAWDPIDASLTVVGEAEPLLEFRSNFNLIAANSRSTPPGGVRGELVFVGAGRPEDFEGIEVAGKIGRTRSRGSNRADSWKSIPIVRIANIGLEPGDGRLDDMIADVKKGIWIEGRGSFSIDQKRYNFQFGGDAFWLIENGKRKHMLRDVIYHGITPEFWGKCDAVAGREHRQRFGFITCGKGQPAQSGWMTHAAAPARFRGVDVITGGAEA